MRPKSNFTQIIVLSQKYTQLDLIGPIILSIFISLILNYCNNKAKTIMSLFKFFVDCSFTFLKFYSHGFV